MKMKLMRVAFRNIARNMRRSILSGSAIAVAAMSIVLLFALIQGMRDDMANNLKTYYTGEVRLQNARYEEFERYNPIHLTLDWEKIDPILAQESFVKAAVPRINFPANLYIKGTSHAVMGVGADFAREAAFQDTAAIVKEGRLPQAGRNEMLMGSALARDLELELGDRVTLLSNTASRGSNAITLEIVGLSAFPVGALNARYVWVPLDRVQKFLLMGTDTQEILILLQPKTNEAKAALTIHNDILAATGVDTDTRSWKDINVLYSLIDIAQYIYYLIGIFFFLLGSTVIINTTMMVIYERMREIGTLSALGMQGHELTGLFLMEGAFISSIGAAVGVIAGMCITFYLGKAGLDFTDAMSGIDMEISSILYPHFSIWSALFVYVYAVVISTAATLIPSHKASKIEPVEALRYI